jgi:hypothetical protein
MKFFLLLPKRSLGEVHSQAEPGERGGDEGARDAGELIRSGMRGATRRGR